MKLGSLVIVGDIFGVVTDVDATYVHVCDKFGITRKFLKDKAIEVCNAHALALFAYQRVLYRR